MYLNRGKPMPSLHLGLACILVSSLVGFSVLCAWLETESEAKLCINSWIYYYYSKWIIWKSSVHLDLTRLGQSLLFGLWMMLFTWMITYMDSNKPGVQPPSPVSPRKLRLQSGHTFHLGYALALVNGLAFAVLSFNTIDRSL